MSTTGYSYAQVVMWMSPIGAAHGTRAKKY